MSNKAEFLANEAAIRAIPVKECKSPTMQVEKSVE